MPENVRVTRQALWKIYFVVLVLLNSPNYLQQSYARVWESVDALFFILSLIGLFGNIWHRRLVGLRFWQAFVPLFILWQVSYHYVIAHSEHHAFLSGATGLSPGNVTTVLMLILLPALNALWVYAYENRGLWRPYVFTASSFREQSAPDAPAS